MNLITIKKSTNSSHPSHAPPLTHENDIVSQDLDEIFVIANSISIMFEGKLSKPYPVSDITLEEIGLLMVGGGSKE